MNRERPRRGGSARQRGPSPEQVAMPIAIDRCGATLCAFLPAATAKAISKALGSDARLATATDRPYPPCAAALRITHEVLDRTAGQRVRGDLHIQTAGSRHEPPDTFPRRYRDTPTRHLANWQKGFHLAGLHPDPTPRACLDAVMGRG